MSIKPVKYPLTIYKGATFHKKITILSGLLGSPPEDLTNAEGSFAIYDAPGGNLLQQNTDSASGLIFGGQYGTVDIIIPAITTATYTWTTGAYHLFVTTIDTDPILYGSVTVKTI